MCAAFADVQRRLPIRVHAPAGDFADYQLMIAGSVPTDNDAIEMAERQSQDRYAGWRWIDVEADERRLPELEAFAEMLEKIRIPGRDDVDNEGRCVREQAMHGPARLDRNANLRRIEGALLYPTRQHSCRSVAQSCGKDEESARHSAQGGSQRLIVRHVGSHFASNSTTSLAITA